jgi:hypothetical protein
LGILFDSRPPLSSTASQQLTFMRRAENRKAPVAARAALQGAGSDE